MYVAFKNRITDFSNSGKLEVAEITRKMKKNYFNDADKMIFSQDIYISVSLIIAFRRVHKNLQFGSDFNNIFNNHFYIATEYYTTVWFISVWLVTDIFYSMQNVTLSKIWQITNESVSTQKLIIINNNFNLTF